MGPDGMCMTFAAVRHFSRLRENHPRRAPPFISLPVAVVVTAHTHADEFIPDFLRKLELALRFSAWLRSTELKASRGKAPILALPFYKERVEDQWDRNPKIDPLLLEEGPLAFGGRVDVNPISQQPQADTKTQLTVQVMDGIITMEYKSVRLSEVSSEAERTAQPPF
ncbi:hypothetical protein AOLI_G00090580 [Acnodon oligacanthus]